MTGQPFTPREMLDRLVAFDTTSRDGNLPLIGFVEDYLASWNIPSFRVDYEAGKKTNLYATIGPEGPGGIVMSEGTANFATRLLIEQLRGPQPSIGFAGNSSFCTLLTGSRRRTMLFLRSRSQRTMFDRPG